MPESERKGEDICAYLHSIVHTRAIVQEIDGPMLEVTVSLTNIPGTSARSRRVRRGYIYKDAE